MTMTRHELERAMGQAWGGWAFCRNYNKHVPGHYPKTKTAAYAVEYRRLRAMLHRGEYRPEVNERGNTVLRDREADKALRINFRPCIDDASAFYRVMTEWQEFPTRQDADYFGVWYHEERRHVFTYCEGDRVLVKCPTRESFEAELADARAFYGPPPSYS